MARSSTYASSRNDIQMSARRMLPAARAWQARKAQARYARITWPVEWGGAGGSAIQQAIFSQEESRSGAPPGFFGIGLGMCMPTLMKFATADVQRRFIGPALQRRADLVSTVLRAERRVRHRRIAHPCDPSGQGLADQRAEGMDHGRPLFGLRPAAGAQRLRRAQAPGSHHVLARHARAGRRDPGHPSNDRTLGVQRGMPRRCQDHRRSADRPEPGRVGRSRSSRS